MAILFHLLICVFCVFKNHCIYVLVYYVLIYSAAQLQECLINLLTYLLYCTVQTEVKETSVAVSGLRPPSMSMNYCAVL